MTREAIERAAELTLAAAVGASCMIVSPIFRRLMARPVRVLITGAAGQIGYALAPMIARGEMFGKHIPVCLNLFDVPSAENALMALKMELEDSAFPYLQELIASTEESEAFQDVDVAILIAGMQYKSGMKRTYILEKNVEMYKLHGQALSEFASKKVKILVVASPANTNALIVKDYAANIPPENITCLTRLDHNRALYQIAQKLECHVSEVKNVIIWGNHSSTQFPDAFHGSASSIPIPEVLVGEPDWIRTEFITTVQNREDDVIKARNLSSALSTSAAICDHMRDWINGKQPLLDIPGTPRGTWVSMGVISDGSYGVPMGLIYSFPVTCSRGRWRIVQGLEVYDDFSRKKMKATADELVEERSLALQCVSSRSGRPSMTRG